MPRLLQNSKEMGLVCISRSPNSRVMLPTACPQGQSLLLGIKKTEMGQACLPFHLCVEDRCSASVCGHRLSYSFLRDITILLCCDVGAACDSWCWEDNFMGSIFSPSTLEWDPEIELRCPGLLHQLRHLDCLVCIWFWMWSKEGSYLLNSDFSVYITDSSPVLLVLSRQ